jgi:hypothetical protein
MPFSLFKIAAGVIRTIGSLKFAKADVDGLTDTDSPTFAAITAGYATIAADGSISSHAGNNAVSGSTQFSLSSRTPQVKLTTVRQTVGDAALSTALIDAYAQNNHSTVLMVRMGVYGSVAQGVAPSCTYTYFGAAFNDTIVRFYADKNVTFDGNVGVGQLTFGTGATKTLAIGTGTNPSTSPADAFQMYSADQAAGNACPHVRTENGAVVKVFQGAAVADATDGTTAIARLNDLLARMRANGLIAT